MRFAEFTTKAGRRLAEHPQNVELYLGAHGGALLYQLHGDKDEYDLACTFEEALAELNAALVENEPAEIDLLRAENERVIDLIQRAYQEGNEDGLRSRRQDPADVAERILAVVITEPSEEEERDG